MSWLVFAIGLAVFWSPPIAALLGGRVTNAIFPLTPTALVATVVWMRARASLFPSGGLGQLSPGIRATAVISAGLMILWTGGAIASIQSAKTVLVIFIGWSIIVGVAPLGLWQYNRVSKALPKADEPKQSMVDWLDELPPDK